MLVNCLTNYSGLTLVLTWFIRFGVLFQLVHEMIEVFLLALPVL